MCGKGGEKVKITNANLNGQVIEKIGGKAGLCGKYELRARHDRSERLWATHKTMNACSETAIPSYKRYSYNHAFTRARELRSIRAVSIYQNKVLEEKENRFIFEITG